MRALKQRLWRIGLFFCIVGYFYAIMIKWGLGWRSLRYCALGSCLCMVAWIDWRTMLIPDQLQILMALLTLLRVPAEGSYGIIDALYGAMAISLPLFFFVLLMNKIFKRETMGGGDIKLLAVLGLHFGVILTWKLLTIACWLALIYAVVSKKQRKEEIPFGPYLAMATWICMLW